MLWLWHHPKMKLFIVMLATPALMNSMQYLIVDTFIDSAHNKSAARIASDRQPYLEHRSTSDRIPSSEARPTTPLIPEPLPESISVDGQFQDSPSFVSFTDVEGYVDKQRLLPKAGFVRWCKSKSDDFKEYFGMDKLSDDELKSIFDFIA